MMQFYHYQLMRERRREREQRYLLREPRAGAWQRVLDRLRTLFRRPRANKQQRRSMPMPLQAAVSAETWLTQNGFGADQIEILYRLRRWYQMCNREQVVMLSHWEFLKLLVNSGKLEL